ncbi:MAG: hypothetical protein ACM359_16685 [Bacillota bacterium]
MDVSIVLTVIFRWLHIIAAALVIGGVFFVCLVLPAGMQTMDIQTHQNAVRAWRRVFKMVVHSCILLLLASGIYNSIRLFPRYAAQPGLLHGLWGGHLLLALVAFAMALWLLAGKEPRPGHRKWMLVNLLLLLLAVAVASALKTAREAAPPQRPSVIGALSN